MNFLPTSKKEVEVLGWDYIDVILFMGDAYVDHPSFGVPVIARVLEAKGYRVAVVPQPNWRDDLRDFRKLGRPRLFFGVGAGAMDSMVNHYTAAKRLRSDDAYTPDGRAGARPDRATIVYTRILKQLWPEVPVVIGGIEASLRRDRHYDYWDNCMKPPILEESGADYLVAGMGEKPMVQITQALAEGRGDTLPRILFGGPLTTEELDWVYDLPFTRLPHPRYKGKRIPAYDMIKFSITTHRGCFGGCNFCAITRASRSSRAARRRSCVKWRHSRGIRSGRVRSPTSALRRPTCTGWADTTRASVKSASGLPASSRTSAATSTMTIHRCCSFTKRCSRYPA